MATERTIENTGRPLVFGEVLYDHFPDGHAVLGGAPFNVAWHLQGFGLSPLFISRIGTDAAGDHVINTMTEWNMDIKGVQRDQEHPTGTVNVSITAGQPSFDICQDQAYDYIEQRPINRLLANSAFSLLYHGSLVLRNRVTRETLHWLTPQFSRSIFVDINLRPPWFDLHEIRWALNNAHWLKLNIDELNQLTPQQNPSVDVLPRGRSLLNQYELDLLILTLGENGAYLIDNSTELHDKPSQTPGLIDTVGAGDAFSAVTILGILLGWDRAKTLSNALEFSSAICSVRGATLSDHAFYRRFIERWELNI